MVLCIFTHFSDSHHGFPTERKTPEDKNVFWVLMKRLRMKYSWIWHCQWTWNPVTFCSSNMKDYYSRALMQSCLHKLKCLEHMEETEGKYFVHDLWIFLMPAVCSSMLRVRWIWFQNTRNWPDKQTVMRKKT